MKITTILMTGLLLASPALAQHEHGEEHGQEPAATPQKMTMPTTLGEQTTCPISGEELEDKDSFVDYAGQRIYVCCKKCKKKAAMKPEQVAMSLYAEGVQLENVQTIDPVTGKKLENKDNYHQIYNMRIYVNDEKSLSKVAADPAKYLDVLAGRHAQTKCAVKGGDLDPEANFVIDGMTIGQCCPGCEKKWHADAAGLFSKLAKDKVVLEPASMKCPVMPGMNGSKKFPVTLGSKRYYLCSEKTAVMFAKNPDKYLPGWLKAQGLEAEATPAGHEAEVPGEHDHGSMQMEECSDCGDAAASSADCCEAPPIKG